MVICTVIMISSGLNFSAKTINNPIYLDGVESVSDGIKTSDGFNIVVGKSSNKKPIIIKYDNEMNIIKQEEYTSLNASSISQEFVKIVELNDGSFITLDYIIGNNETHNSDDLEIVKYDSELNYTKSYFIDGGGNDFYGDLMIMDNNIILTGDTSIPNNSKDIFVAKFDLDLNLLEYKVYGDKNLQIIASSVIINNKIVINYQDILENSILIINDDLSIGKNIAIIDEDIGIINSLMTYETTNGNFLIGGVGQNDKSILYLGIYDKELNLIQKRLISVPNLENIIKIFDIQELVNGNFIITGSTKTGIISNQAYNVLEVDSNLNSIDYTYLNPSEIYNSNIINNAQVLENGDTIFNSTVIIQNSGEIKGEIVKDTND